ncbi:ribonuclease P protein component 4 [Candidatus Nitrosotenuis cloacae]|uniref:Ribonuclease P protein component 4 n=1 Tax=Candidatus Nitrosotenuis cloacae TaxID=1603555 RepID=A0A3G1B523_9ARCH|nr:RNase P subunit [Candidatus Nitrosotenuis cloacae]AJZ75870.1 RNase P subunit [Candidatus Nitrosotenuis cloacae]
MKPSPKQIALERIQIILKEAQSNILSDPELAQKQASLAKRISTKYRVRLPYDIRMQFCKKCKSFIPPGVNARIRVGRSTLKSIRITCRFCNHTYRKVIVQPK